MKSKITFFMAGPKTKNKTHLFFCLCLLFIFPANLIDRIAICFFSFLCLHLTPLKGVLGVGTRRDQQKKKVLEGDVRRLTLIRRKKQCPVRITAFVDPKEEYSPFLGAIFYPTDQQGVFFSHKKGDVKMNKLNKISFYCAWSRG